MKKTRIILSAICVLLAAGCDKEIVPATETPVPAPEGKTVLTAGIEGITRTELQTNLKVYWTSTDAIAVNGNASSSVSVGDPASSATFNFDAVLETPYKAVFPASIYKNATTVTLPAVQEKGTSTSFASNSAPMAAYAASGAGLAFHNLAAVVKLSVTAGLGGTDVSYVEFAGKDNEQVSGDFTIDYETAVLRSASGAEAGKTVRVRVDRNLSETAQAIYVVVPARSYASGFTVKLVDKNGHFMTKSVSSNIELAKGQIVNMPEFAFVPTGTELGVEISNAQELIDFATAYNAGDYADLGATLIATVTDDIVFDAASSETFNATGGIGTADDANRFDGLFKGNGKTISGLESTVVLFNGTTSAATIKDLTVDGTCSFTFTNPNSGNFEKGAVVGYHRGTLDNVKVAAGVSLADVSDVTTLASLGGLVGRIVVGSIENGCEYSGLISVPAGYAGTAKLYIGGLAGEITNANGSVKGSFFKGAISTEAQITSTDKNNPYTVIGGVVGYLSAGNVSSCGSTADHETVAGAYTGSAGILVDKSTVAYHSAIGGIVGENVAGTVSGCTNAATIFNTIYKVGGDGSRYIHAGGIAGKNGADGTVSGCINNGAITHRSNPRIQNLGGIVGLNNGTVASCTNNAVVAHSTSGQSVKSGRVVSLGGVIGQNTASNKVSDVHNTANLEISNMEDGTASEPFLGGVIGQNTGIIDGGAEKNITNSGRVYFSPNFSSQFLGYNLGGVVGKSSASVKNVKNSGYVYFRWNSSTNVASLVYLGGIVGRMIGDGEISGCVNEGGSSNAGEVYPNVAAGSAGHNNIFAGGILGYTVNNVTISDCSNSGYVHGGNSNTVSGTSFYAGGIVAYLKGESGILNCSNTGSVVTTHAGINDTIGSTCLTGGIAGYVEGTSESTIPIGGTTGCTVNTTAALSATRGWIGGVVAYAKYAEISDCTVENIIGGGCAARGAGGIVGKAEYCTISSCYYKGDTIKANQIQAANGEGGIAGYIDNSTIDGCYCYATTFLNNTSQPFGGIAGVSNTNNTIKNCHYKSAVEGPTAGNSVTATVVGSGTFTGSGNVADL